MREADVDEQRTGVGVGRPRVHRGQRMVEPAEHQVVHRAEQHVREVARGGASPMSASTASLLATVRQMRSYSGEYAAHPVSANHVHTEARSSVTNASTTTVARVLTILADEPRTGHGGEGLVPTASWRPASASMAMAVTPM